MNGIVKMSSSDLRNQFYLASLQAANHHRLPLTNESEESTNCTRTRTETVKSFNFLSFHTKISEELKAFEIPAHEHGKVFVNGLQISAQG